MISQGLSSYNFKAHVASDIFGDHNQFLPADNFQSQGHLRKIDDRTKMNLMQLNEAKSKYMIVNYTDNYQFSTRLHLNDKILEQVEETLLL